MNMDDTIIEQVSEEDREDLEEDNLIREQEFFEGDESMCTVH